MRVSGLGLANGTFSLRTLKLERVAKRREDEIWFVLAGEVPALSYRGHKPAPFSPLPSFSRHSPHGRLISFQ